MTNNSIEKISEVTDDSGNQPSGPDGLPILGNTLGFIRHPMLFIGQLSNHGNVVRREFPMIQAVALLHSDNIKDILLADQQTYRRWNFDQLRKIGDYNFAPEGLAFTEGATWHNSVAIFNRCSISIDSKGTQTP